MRRILVTGANKGIGRAIARAILAEHADTFVLLGSRDEGRGREAATALTGENASWGARLAVVPIDVADERSVASARARVQDLLGAEQLYGLVNNAGLGGESSLAEILAVNALGVRRVTEAFLPMLERGVGRVVNVTSASGPTFVAGCSPEMQRFFLDGTMTWPRLAAFIDECLAMGSDKAAFAARGLGDGNAYGLSKACANAYTRIVAREHPELIVNACTPGFIETDMTRHYVAGQGKSAAELGMKSPAEGTRSTMFLLFGAPGGSGRYFGSDALRSPLDRYRAPGSPAYAGD